MVYKIINPSNCCHVILLLIVFEIALFFMLPCIRSQMKHGLQSSSRDPELNLRGDEWEKDH